MINNGPSIYKFGGGGGGLSDGGNLIDDAYIIVQNNTLSNYNNVSNREQINFVFESDEILNAIIEVSTAVDAEIRVYKYQNNLYTQLGYISTNQIQANGNYNIVVNDNCFYIQDIINSGSVNIEKIGDDLYSFVTVGTLKFLSENYRSNINNVDSVKVDNVRYYKVDDTLRKTTLPNGWRFPNYYDFSYLASYLNPNMASKMKSNTTIYPSWNATASNSSGISLNPDGRFNTLNNTVENKGSSCYFPRLANDFINWNLATYNINDDSLGGVEPNKYYTLRLVKDA